MTHTCSCGHLNPLEALFCTGCGTRLAPALPDNPYAAPQSDLSEEPGNAADALAARFVGKRFNDYYGPRWGRSNPGWNWAAFLLGSVWMAYRKMYGYCMIFLGLVIAETVLEIVLNVPDSIGRMISIAIGVAFGITGTRLYQHHVQTRCAHIAELPQAEQEAAIRRSGGTSWPGAIGMLVLMLALVFGIFTVAEIVLSAGNLN
ncbi:DUF2628 domain-containing protein [Chitinilyticum piscinae]|uniref:DUF2628 domain-containing protein n=1 Tax=Chitinilyticum piscinae TaxID=2866724 RepID=A0A8J7G253_9NEIS|nr:DUF2628 domain-containing protein [Chitinilyticum piscinae]MBE9610580.1 DUF2628 domain-containing protein [Chitinilyticum piscinae]